MAILYKLFQKGGNGKVKKNSKKSSDFLGTGGGWGDTKIGEASSKKESRKEDRRWKAAENKVAKEKKTLLKGYKKDAKAKKRLDKKVDRNLKKQLK